jgi:hypothetical protein
MDTIAYHVRDRVILNRMHYKTCQQMYKLELRWERPFEVLKASLHAVTLRLPANIKIFNTCYISMVKTYNGNGVPGQSKTNDDVRAHRGRKVIGTDEGVETEEWRFEKVLDFGKANNGRWQYLVKWEGYNELTCQPGGDLCGCDDTIWEFHDTNPNKPRPLAWVTRRNNRRQELRM